MNIHIIKKIISSGTVTEKCNLFAELKKSIIDWDIIPLDIISQGFDDSAPEVRQAAVELFCDIPQDLPEIPWFKLSAMLCDPDSAIRESVQKHIEFIAQGLSYEDVKKLLTCLKHRSRFTFESFIHLFSLIPEHFDKALCMKVVEIYHNGSVKERNIIGDFLDTCGQGHLINTVHRE